MIFRPLRPETLIFGGPTKSPISSEGTKVVTMSANGSFGYLQQRQHLVYLTKSWSIPKDIVPKHYLSEKIDLKISYRDITIYPKYCTHVRNPILDPLNLTFWMYFYTESLFS